jgi:hypothetical protein
MIELSEYLRRIAPPSFISRRNDGIVSIDFVVPDTVWPGPHRSTLQMFHEQCQNDLVFLGHVEAQGYFPGHRTVAALAKRHVETALTVSEASQIVADSLGNHRYV